MKKKTKKNNNNSTLIILLSVIIAILLIILTIVLVANSKKEPSNNEIPNYNAPTNNESNTENTNDYISKEKALDIVLKHAKLNQNDVYDLSIELEYKYKNYVYEIDFNYKQYEYEYYINATDGKIIYSFKEFD